MTEYQFQTLDVFTKQKFAGNPLAIVFEAGDLSTEQMQTITNEFNLSETTFILPPENPENTARVRIFTLGYEMPFAGHPTVGTAIAIAKARGLSGQLMLELNAGLFPVEVELDQNISFAKFTNPNIPDEIAPAPSIEKLANAFGLEASDIDAGEHRPRFCGSGGVNYVYACANLEVVQRARLHHGGYSDLKLSETVGVYLYARGGIDPDTSYHARMFAPDAGIPEDPATGSAAAGFPAQLLMAGALKEGEQRLKIEQGYEMERPSQIHLEVQVTNDVLKSIRIGGYAESVMSGHISI